MHKRVPTTATIVIALLLSFSHSSPLQADDTLRCGTRLIQKDDLAIQVREKCGKPVSQEIIGYTLRNEYQYQTNRQREYKIEQWLYGPYRGFYQEIIFEAGKVKQINRIKD
ncbi:DUF2845 domain-containing protein [Oceanicoccus sagamiensis]|uniref:DUF2845 domain-containing protein n=1 Tax=Oceanicoccus sagamiensis TaxID=716816 RepID=A0A1X9NR37_9GAMM|nr:DUF2845 domain-containing protein [Oceanicoccus sagamiensis]ARN76263.1 hypothetical protein BST96_01855 [Oceanicoccus sagamiensis]